MGKIRRLGQGQPTTRIVQHVGSSLDNGGCVSAQQWLTLSVVRAGYCRWVGRGGRDTSRDGATMSEQERSARPAVVLHVINSLGVSGGAEQQLVSNLAHFADSRFEHHIAYLYEYDFETRTETAARVAASVHQVLPTGSKRSRRQAIRRLGAVVEELEPALIHCSLADASLAARVVGWRRNIPVIESLVNIAHDSVRLVDNPNVKAWKLCAHRFVDRITTRRVAAFHALSNVVARSWHESVGIDMDRIHVIPRGVDVEGLDAQAETGPNPGDLAHEFEFNADANIILSVGRHEPQKGQRYLIEAMPMILKTHPNTVLLIAGRPGSVSEGLEQTVTRVGVESAVRILGRRTDVAALVKASDVFVFPSLYEGLGVSLLEALALGAAVATSDIEPMNDVVTDGDNGRLFKPMSPDDISLVVSELLGDIGQRERLGEAGRVTIAGSYTAVAAAQKLEQLYRDVLQTKE